MNTRISSKSETYYGRKAVGCLAQKFNCPAATMQTCQDMICQKEDGVLTSVAGLVAGVKGSTCGVVSGGALGIALLHKDEIQTNDTRREVGVLSLASDFVNWFDKTYGTTHCSKRSQVDFWTLRGLMKYLFPGHRMIPCMKHINGSMKYLYRHQNVGLPEIEFMEDYGTENIHCSQAVLRGIKAETGLGDPVLERISLVLDGGVALGGGICGALAGAVLALNLLLGDNLRDVSLPGSYYRMFKGLTLLRSNKDEDSPNPFYAVKKITNDFEGKAGSINCSSIIDRKFVNWDGFQSFIQTSDKCKDLIDFSIRETSKAINHYRS